MWTLVNLKELNTTGFSFSRNLLPTQYLAIVIIKGVSRNYSNTYEFFAKMNDGF